MKKIILKFTSMFLALVVLASCLVIQVSAESTAEVLNEPLLKSLPEVPVKYLGNFFEDDTLIYNKFVIYRYFYNNKTYYSIYAVGDAKNDSDISYISLGTSSSTFRDINNNSLSFHCILALYNQDASTFTSSKYVNSYVSGISLNCNYYTVNGADLAVETAVKNIVYSDYPIKYAGLTVFNPAEDNKAFTIPGLFDSSGSSSTGPQPLPSQPGDYDFVGPLPLIPIEGDPTYQGFKDWLIKNEKYKDLAKHGVNCTSENISAVVDLWTGNYNSITSFFTGLKSMWGTINAVSQAKNIYNWFEQQWQLYKKSLTTYETIPIKDKDKVFNYDTDYDEDGNFISSESAYLKLILGVLMAFRNDINSFSDNFVSYISSISVNINRLCNAVSTLPQVTADSIYNNLVNPFNLILDAINNSSSGSSTTENITNNTNNYYTYNTEISEDEYDEFDNLFTEYNQQYDEIIKSKFPFISQVISIFDEVWKACGYDETSVLSDNISTYSQSYALLSATPQQTQEDKVNSAMSSLFPAYNKSYLGSVSSNAPQFNINVAGTEVSIIDFRLFDKYRSIIHAIINLCIWLPYLWSLCKAVPGIIANVGDVNNISVGNISNFDFESNAIVESEQLESNKIEDFDVFVKNEDGTYSAYKSENGWSKK